MHAVQVNGPEDCGVTTWALQDDLFFMFHMPLIMCKCGFAVVITKFCYGEEVFPLHVREDVGVSCGWWKHGKLEFSSVGGCHAGAIKKGFSDPWLGWGFVGYRGVWQQKVAGAAWVLSLIHI